MSLKPSITTIASPQLLDLYNLKDSIFVVIDVFRATSTIATALYNGAKQVIPVTNTEDCIRIGKATENSVTAGEREGKVIPGLQHGNSPHEYGIDFIQNKTLVITTTNGTKLLNMALKNGAASVLTGSFPNLSSIVAYLKTQKKNVILGCSAWKNIINIEDTLFAGAVATALKEDFEINCDSTTMAMSLYESNQQDLLPFVKKASHWKRLSAYGLEEDLKYCITPDVANILVMYQNGKLLKF